jgi:predicted deacylase
LARLLESRAILLAKNSGGDPLDECLSGVWWQLGDNLAAAGLDVPLPQGCCTTTIELRGEGDVSHAWAKADAQAVFAYLQLEAAVACASLPNIPPLLCQPTPLAGSQTLRASVPGIIVFAVNVGDTVQAGDLVAEIVDPIAQVAYPVLAGVDGVLYARVRERYAVAGGELGKIAGEKPFRTGNLLGA